jgi:hypothetical protein
MTLDQLQIFIAVAEREHVTRGRRPRTCPSFGIGSGGVTRTGVSISSEPGPCTISVYPFDPAFRNHRSAGSRSAPTGTPP